MDVVRFDQIARECRETFKGSFEGKPIVGLEHIEPYDMLLKNYDVDVETTFTKSFKKGQILFGRRRAYQHKACVATCDGICSGDITVIEPIEGVIYPDLLPFVVQNDDFFEHAIKGSNGALSPRVKWEHMANYEINLPSLPVQKVLAEKLWAAYEVKQSYLKMIDATQEMVKAQFVEMFGDFSINSKNWPVNCLGNLAEIKIGPFGSLIHQSDYKEGGHCLINPSQIIDNKIVPDSKVAVSDEKYHELESYIIGYGDIVLGRRGDMGRAGIVETEGMLCGTGSMVIRPKDKDDTFFLHLYITSQQSKKWLESNSVGTTMMNLNTQIVGKMEVPVLPTALKHQFIAIAHQADKSISELRKSIDAIDKVIKSLINENL